MIEELERDIREAAAEEPDRLEAERLRLLAEEIADAVTPRRRGAHSADMPRES